MCSINCKYIILLSLLVHFYFFYTEYKLRPKKELIKTILHYQQYHNKCSPQRRAGVARCCASTECHKVYVRDMFKKEFNKMNSNK